MFAGRGTGIRRIDTEIAGVGEGGVFDGGDAAHGDFIGAGGGEIGGVKDGVAHLEGGGEIELEAAFVDVGLHSCGGGGVIVVAEFAGGGERGGVGGGTGEDGELRGVQPTGEIA